MVVRYQPPPGIPEGVRIMRDGTAVVVEHDCAPTLSVRIELGAHAHTFTDHEILDRHNQLLLALTAATIPSPQLKWDDATDRWRPSGRTIVCEVEAAAGESVAIIDDVELSIAEFADVLSNHGAHVCLAFLDE